MKEPHKYRSLSKEEQEELFSNYLLDSWSYSKVASFARNEKAFEMVYVYGEKGKRSASEVAGSAYHYALSYYFIELKERAQKLDIAALQIMAFNFIDEVKVDTWKLQKTTPTIAECIEKATSLANTLIKNFLNDISIYESEIKEILFVEHKFDEFVTINGVDIPLPCHGVIDLGIITKEDKRVIIDHKSKATFTDEKELKFSIGKQAMTYVKGYETATGNIVDEVWFVENKSSENRDKSPQLSCFKIAIDKDVRRLYEAMLYEPLRRMIEAISNHDYVYLINESDNFIDKAEIWEFWARTMIAEVSDFNIPDNKIEMIDKRLKKIKDSSLAMIDPKAIKKFRENAASFITYDLTNKDMTKQEKIIHTLRTLGTSISIPYIFEGYSSDTFLLEVTAGTNISSLYKYRLDIANALSVSSIRMMKDLYVHEGRSFVAVESAKVRNKDLMFDPKYLQGSKIPLGIDNFENVIYWDISNPSTPHMLICGSTGSGKSVSIISTLEYAKLLGFDEIYIFDPKFEFIKYAGGNVKVFNDIEIIETQMENLVTKMNLLVREQRVEKTLIIFDEFADAVANSKKGNELNVYENIPTGNFDKFGNEKMKRENVGTKYSLEENLRIILQKGRSSGFRCIAATQRASTKVITGDAKVNFPVQLCFKVPKEIDSKVVLDDSGAESLSGKGDGLIKSPEYQGIVRFQAFFKQ